MTTISPAYKLSKRTMKSIILAKNSKIKNSFKSQHELHTSPVPTFECSNFIDKLTPSGIYTKNMFHVLFIRDIGWSIINLLFKSLFVYLES